METVFAFLKYAFLGFFGLIAALFVLAIVFGKRIVKQWEFDAEFRDANGREFGELDIELSRIAKEETVDTFKAKFKMRHESLQVGQRVQVFVDDVLVLEGAVETAGRIWLTQENCKNSLQSASAGQLCRVVYGGVEQFSEPLVRD
ncbi:MAG: hypothetical protein K0U72_16620 [Gammaproteobacteria bacterium]|nr:hypothetical protein [Gammaproteobacteria bacterium]